MPCVWSRGTGAPPLGLELNHPRGTRAGARQRRAAPLTLPPPNTLPAVSPAPPLYLPSTRHPLLRAVSRQARRRGKKGKTPSPAHGTPERRLDARPCPLSHRPTCVWRGGGGGCVAAPHSAPADGRPAAGCIRQHGRALLLVFPPPPCPSAPLCQRARREGGRGGRGGGNGQNQAEQRDRRAGDHRHDGGKAAAVAWESCLREAPRMCDRDPPALAAAAGRRPFRWNPHSQTHISTCSRL